MTKLRVTQMVADVEMNLRTRSDSDTEIDSDDETQPPKRRLANYCNFKKRTIRYVILLVCMTMATIAILIGLGMNNRNQPEQCLYEHDGNHYNCTEFNESECPSAVAALKAYDIKPQQCKAPNKICCVPNFDSGPSTSSATSVTMGLTTKLLPLSKTTAFDQEIDNDTSNEDYTPTCPPLFEKTGDMALDMCHEFYEKYIMPCEPSSALDGQRDYTRKSRCPRSTPLISGGEDAYPGEFPYAAIVGFEDDITIAPCNAVIVDYYHLVTAAHCTEQKGINAAYVWTNITRRSVMTNFMNMYEIDEIIRHPEYVDKIKYNDLAILRTKVKMRFDAYSHPACLTKIIAETYEQALAAGYGKTSAYSYQLADNLQKTKLDRYEPSVCKDHYPPNIDTLPRGFDEDTQECLGERYGTKDADNKDTCLGDSGCGVVIPHETVPCMYNLVGVASFARAECGLPGYSSIYTKIAANREWIIRTAIEYNDKVSKNGKKSHSKSRGKR